MTAEITEEQVTTWLTDRLKQMREAGLPIHHIQLDMHIDEKGQPYTSWCGHCAGQCVVCMPSSSAVDKALREEYRGSNAIAKKRESAARLLREADELEKLQASEPVVIQSST